ncbi:MAG: S9 family peptidase [Pseudomonadota bacterium]
MTTNTLCSDMPNKRRLAVTNLVAFVSIALLCFLAGPVSAAEKASASEKRPFSAMDVFELEYASDPQVSPDGTQVAYVRRSMDIMTDRALSNIWMVSADGKSHRPLFAQAASYGSPRWSPDGTRIAYVAKAEQDRGAEIFIYYLDTGRSNVVSNLPESPSGLAWSPDGTSIAFTMFQPADGPSFAAPLKKPKGAEWADPVKVIDQVTYRRDGSGFADPGHRHIFVVPADGGTPRQMTDGPYNHSQPSWSADGSSILFVANRADDAALDPVESEIFAVSISSKDITQLTDRDGPDFGPILSPNKDKLAYLGFDDKKLGYQAAEVFVMNADGSGVKKISGSFDRDIEDLAWASNDTMIVQYDDKGRKLLARLNVSSGDIKPIVNDLGGTTLGRPYTSGGFSISTNGVVAYTSGNTLRPADVAIIGSDGKAKRLTKLNDDLFSEVAVQDVESITWKGPDGYDVQGWIMKPPSFDASEKYPFILEIHGGPFAAYGPNFAAEIQLYAAAGYVVLYTNPRGSTSYGAKFANEIHHNYPSKDYDDLMAGVDAVIQKGYIDDSQLFVTGGSGGGVLSAWIVGKTNRFAAAVVAKPVINWTSFSLTADSYPFFTQYWFAKPPWEDPEGYWARSPLSLVGNVETPTMLLTGESDYRTPISETEQYYQALKLRKIDTAMVRVPGASHGIASRPSNLAAKVGNILGWFQQYRTDGDADVNEATEDKTDQKEAAGN